MSVFYKSLRHICVSSTPPKLTKFTLHPPKSVEVEFSDGSLFNLSSEFLRVQSPAADSKIRSVNGEKVEFFFRLYSGDDMSVLCRRSLWETMESDLFSMTCIKLESTHGIISII